MPVYTKRDNLGSQQPLQLVSGPVPRYVLPAPRTTVPSAFVLPCKTTRSALKRIFRHRKHMHSQHQCAQAPINVIRRQHQCNYASINILECSLIPHTKWVLCLLLPPLHRSAEIRVCLVNRRQRQLAQSTTGSARTTPKPSVIFRTSLTPGAEFHPADPGVCTGLAH